MTSIATPSNISNTEPEAPVLPTEKQTMAVFLALLEALSYQVMNPDIWWLAEHSAKQTANEYGISEKVFTEVMIRFEKARKQKGQTNPMSSMF